MSDSTIHEIECTYLEGVSEPPHRESEATMISNDLTSTSIVSSHLVLGLIYDDAPIRDDYVLPLDKTMAMGEYDAPPTWFHQDEDDHHLVFASSPTPLEWNENGNIGEGDTLVPLVDILDIDCLHDVDQPIPMLHASATSSCHDLPIYDEYDDEHVELPSCDAMLHRISCENSIGHVMFDNPLTLSYDMSEISHIASFQSQHSNYACPIKINPICTYGIDDEMMVIGFCFSSDDIAMLSLHDLRNSSTIPCHDHIEPNMLCFGCCQYSPC